MDTLSESSEPAEDPTSLEEIISPSSKPKRVRTGCLTCRDRHLKCDEGFPTCQNCIKSNRPCARGIRLNWTVKPTTFETEGGPDPSNRSTEKYGSFQIIDESRKIAEEYPGGKELFESYDRIDLWRQRHGYVVSARNAQPATSVGSHSRSTSSLDPHSVSNNGLLTNDTQHSRSYSGVTAGSDHMSPVQATAYHLHNNPTEMLYFQAYVEEVALWMDNLDENKFFSSVLPFYGLQYPSIRFAILACGACHLFLVNDESVNREQRFDEHGERYYKKAHEILEKDMFLKPDERAVTASILSAYDVLLSTTGKRITCLDTVTDLIQGCGWHASHESKAARACFWLNVGMQVIVSIAASRPMRWKPESWNFISAPDYRLFPPKEGLGLYQNVDEEMYWAHHLIYILAQIADFRGADNATQSAVHEEQQLQRVQSWERLRKALDDWDRNKPHVMNPLGQVDTPISRSMFPELFIIKKICVITNVYFHWANVILNQHRPSAPSDIMPHPQDDIINHAKIVCGIVAHIKHRGVASMLLRPTIHCAEYLQDPNQQVEVIRSFKNIQRETGWRLQPVIDSLKNGNWQWPGGQDRLALDRRCLTDEEIVIESQQRFLQQEAAMASNHLRQQQQLAVQSSRSRNQALQFHQMQQMQQAAQQPYHMSSGMQIGAQHAQQQYNQQHFSPTTSSPATMHGYTSTAMHSVHQQDMTAMAPSTPVRSRAATMMQASDFDMSPAFNGQMFERY